MAWRGVSVSKFLVEAAAKEADQVIQRERLLELKREDAERVFALLDHVRVENMKTAYLPLALCVVPWAVSVCEVLASEQTGPAADLVWYDDFADVSPWKAQPGWLSNPAQTATLASENGVAAFRVDQPSQGMKWSRDLPAISLAETPWLVVRYRAENLNRQHSDYLIYLRDGNAKPAVVAVDVHGRGCGRRLAYRRRRRQRV